MGSNRKGNRSAKRGQALALAKAFPERMRAAMDPLLEPYLIEFEFDLRNRTLGETSVDGNPMPNPAHRTAMDLYPRIMQVVGASDDLIAALLRRLNMPNETEMLAASELYRAVQGKDMRDVYLECRKVVDWYEETNGAVRSEATVLDTNGNGGRE